MNGAGKPKTISSLLHFGLHPMAQARFTEYFHPMNNKKLFLKTNKAGFVLGAVLLAALTESAAYADGLRIGVDVDPVVVVAPPVVIASPVAVAPVVAQDNYVYYPNYGVYYNSGRHQYYYLRGDAWVNTAAPDGVTADVLLASPSVNMDWHDSPANHHRDMLQKYPRDWKPAGVHQDQRDDRRDVSPDHDRKPPVQ
jgi:hypothetical protein